MKTTFFRKVLNETTIQVKDCADNIISKFRQLKTINGSTDNNNVELKFSYSPKGDLRIGSLGLSRYMIRGSIFEENGKTVVKLYEVCDYSRIVLRWVILILMTFLVIINTILLGRIRLWMTAVWLIYSILAVRTSINEKRNKVLSLEVMKKEMEKRIEAAVRWDD